MPPLKPKEGREVWKVYMLDAEEVEAYSLYGGKLFATKDAAERFAFRFVVKYPETIGDIVVDRYTCTEWDGMEQPTLLVALNPPRRRPRRRVAVRHRRRIKQLWTPVETLAKKIDKVCERSDYETVMQAMILSAGVRIGIHSPHGKALSENIKRFTDAVSKVAEYRFMNSTKTPPGDFDDGNW